MAPQNTINSKSKKIFLTFSSNAFKNESEFYQSLINIIEKDCQAIIEHRWYEHTNANDPQRVYNDSLQAIRDCDVFVAEVSAGSTGVGQQITFAIQHKKPVILCLKEEFKDKNNYLFLRGTQSTNVNFIYYSSLDELKMLLCKRIESVHADKLEKFNFVATKRVNEVLEEESYKRKISKSELLRNIVEEWMDRHNLQ